MGEAVKSKVRKGRAALAKEAVTGCRSECLISLRVTVFERKLVVKAAGAVTK